MSFCCTANPSSVGECVALYVGWDEGLKDGFIEGHFVGE